MFLAGSSGRSVTNKNALVRQLVMTSPSEISTSNPHLWGDDSAWKSPPPGSGWGDNKAVASIPTSPDVMSEPFSEQPKLELAKIEAAEEIWQKKQNNIMSGTPWRPGWNSLPRESPRYARGDFSDLEWEWAGAENRDPSLDELPDEVWGPVQLHRCLPGARKQHCPPPTFTGAQLQERKDRVTKQLDSLESHALSLIQEREKVAARVVALEREIEDCRSKSNDLNDQVQVIDEAKKKVREILQDLTDLELIGLCFRQS
ncbi:hypothetical protein V5O48_017235 [Marasmius crinis-equi]|uniref:Uncharacterized protein n=1 Tax=Marasmius crinis-equi TaxID=585013 RepID=A0ABR3EPI5_9AGAR